MTSLSPHYLLFSEASQDPTTAQTWRFVLQNVETQKRLCAADAESGECGERLELLAVVRGLEALDGPSRVTLITRSRYVSRGLKSGLSEWRANNWQWERFGRIVPVRDHDLWQRIDRALQYHQVDCQSWHFDAGEAETTVPVGTTRCAATAPESAVLRRQFRPAPRGSANRSRPAVYRRGRAKSSHRLMGRVRTGVTHVSRLPETLWDLTRPMRESLSAAP